MIDTTTEELLSLVESLAPSWNAGDEVGKKRVIEALRPEQQVVLGRALRAELSGVATFKDRKSFYEDFYEFDARLKSLFVEILNSNTSTAPLREGTSEDLFVRESASESVELEELLRNGYRISRHALPVELQNLLLKQIADCQFINRGIFEVELSGSELMRHIQDGSISKLTGANGDTFWIKDLNQLTQNEFFQRLAFDPYILSMVSNYLGCTPIHVQTNMWFSFPTFAEKNNLSTNAQMFHQDKEFAKFIKVFIYLSDVGEENGPHIYIEGSHIDEAHSYGVPISDRIPDEDISKHYNAERIKTLLGPAGTIAFGDTSCVHKGQAVRSGYRIMLQLEYAASLYLSPVTPFSDLPESALSLLPYPAEVRRRILANYNDQEREAFQAMSAGQPTASPSVARKYMRLIKRYLKRH